VGTIKSDQPKKMGDPEVARFVYGAICARNRRMQRPLFSPQCITM
jgi:hypothetical protein